MNINNETIEGLKERLTAKKENIAVAESVTAGFLQAALGSAIGASDFFEGGITAYNIDQKVRHLGVDRQAADACNCVSEQTAREMAIGVTKMFRSTWGLSVTGYATPVEESGFEVYAFYSIAKGSEVLKAEKIKLEGKKGEDAQLEYVNKILNVLLTLV